MEIALYAGLALGGVCFALLLLLLRDLHTIKRWAAHLPRSQSGHALQPILGAMLTPTPQPTATNDGTAREQARPGGALKKPAEDKPMSSSMAFTCDGRIFVSTAELPTIDLAGREVLTVVALTEAEAREAKKAFDDTAAEATAQIFGRLAQEP